jgi:galactokinase/mevalonate kinase-like predicted kinase
MAGSVWRHFWWQMSVRWLPDYLFNGSDYQGNWLLYYTGVTRVAKNILSEIVRGMFLNESKRLMVLNQIKSHANEMYDAIQKSDYNQACKMIDRSWRLNNQLDSGTNTADIQCIINAIDDFSLGYKLLGAGGGGYMLIGAKDLEASKIIRQQLKSNPINKNARFVDFQVNKDGFQVTQS